MGHPRFTTEEIVIRGQQIYQRHLRDRLEPGNNSKFLVIDVETGEYEMGEADLPPMVNP